MPIRIPTYISKSAPSVVDRGITSPALTGGLVAQGTQSVAGVLAAINLDMAKKVGDNARQTEYEDRTGRMKERIRQLNYELAKDTDHRTYHGRALKGIEEAYAEALDGVKDQGLIKLLRPEVNGIKEKAVVGAQYKSWSLSNEYDSVAGQESLRRSILDALEATDSQGFMRAEGNIEATVKGKVVGGVWSAERGQKYRLDARRTIDTVMADRLADQEPGRFLENYNTGVYRESFIDPRQLEGFRQHATNRMRGAGVDADAEEIWGRLGPKTDVEPANLDQMDRETSTISAQDPDRAKLIRARLREMASAHDKGVAERRDANLDAVMGAEARGASISEILSMREYSALPGTVQANVKHNLIDRARMVTREGKQEQQERWDARYYEIISDPDALASMSAGEFQAVRLEVGGANWRRLDAEKRRLSSPEALAEAKIDNNLFKTLAGKAGYDIAPRTEQGKQKLANLRTNLMDALVALQKDQGRKLRPDEKEKHLKMLVTRVSVGNEDTFLGFTVTQEKPVIEVRNKGNIRVPPDKRKQIIADFKARHGRVPSENQIIDAWIALAQEGE